MSKLPDCPRCQSKNGFQIRGRVTGYGVRFYSGEGTLEDTHFEPEFRPRSWPVVVRCVDCHHIRKDVKYDDLEVRAVAAD